MQVASISVFARSNFTYVKHIKRTYSYVNSGFSKPQLQTGLISCGVGVIYFDVCTIIITQV